LEVGVSNILEILEKHNFSNQRQIDVLRVIEYAISVKYHPEDICDILQKKVQLLQLAIEPVENDSTVHDEIKRTQKVTTDVLISLLKAAGISTASDDKTKIAHLISCLTGFSEEKIRQRLSNPDELTSYHKGELENINKIFSDLNCCISIKYNRMR